MEGIMWCCRIQDEAVSSQVPQEPCVCLHRSYLLPSTSGNAKNPEIYNTTTNQYQPLAGWALPGPETSMELIVSLELLSFLSDLIPPLHCIAPSTFFKKNSVLIYHLFHHRSYPRLPQTPVVVELTPPLDHPPPGIPLQHTPLSTPRFAAPLHPAKCPISSGAIIDIA